MFMYRTAKNVFLQKYNLYLYFAGMFVTPCLSQPKQEAQLSKRGRAMLHVIEYFAKSLRSLGRHWKWHHLIHRIYEFLLAFHSNYGLIFIISVIKPDIG